MGTKKEAEVALEAITKMADALTVEATAEMTEMIGENISYLDDRPQECKELIKNGVDLYYSRNPEDFDTKAYIIEGGPCTTIPKLKNEIENYYKWLFSNFKPQIMLRNAYDYARENGHTHTGAMEAAESMDDTIRSGDLHYCQYAVPHEFGVVCKACGNTECKFD